jgi:hypothetical protein
MRKVGLVLGVSTAMMLALSGCSTPGQQPEPVVSDSLPKLYGAIEDLQQDFIAAGGDCGNGKKQVFRHAVDGLDCGDGYTNLLLFEDRAAAIRWGQASSALCNTMTTCEGGTLVGDNWAIVTQAPELFEKALGGTILK